MSNWLLFRYPGDNASLEVIDLDCVQSFYVQPIAYEDEQEIEYYDLRAVCVSGDIYDISRHEERVDAESYMLQIIGKLGENHDN